MKKTVAILVIAFLSTTMNAQKIAFIHEAKILEALPGYTKAIKETDSIKNVFKTEIKENQDKLNAKSQNLLKGYNFQQEVTYDEVMSKLSEMDKKKFGLLQEESKLFEKQNQSKEEEFKAIYNEKVMVLVNKLNKLIQEYCKANKIAVLLKKDVLDPAIAYFDNDNDLTEILIKKVNSLPSSH